MELHELQTERLRLVIPVAAHVEHYREFFTDADASSGYGGPLTPGQAWTRLAHDRGIWDLRGFGVWIVEEKATGRAVGGCGFWQGLDWPRELTWWLLPTARGTGFATEASQKAIAHAYEVWGWTTVQTYMADDNAAAKGLALRLGGQENCRHTFPDGDERSVYLLPRPDGEYPVAADLG